MAALWDNLPEGVENVKKTWIKCAGLGLLALAAAWSATSALAGMGAAPQRVETKKSSFRYEPSCSVEEAEFVLREYDGCIGGKTGYTKAAGRCLVSCAEREGTRFICVTLDAPDDWADHAALYDWAFAASPSSVMMSRPSEYMSSRPTGYSLLPAPRTSSATVGRPRSSESVVT